MKMKRLFFGGTFDPIHMGHINLALKTIEMGYADVVSFMPCGYPPHKSSTGADAGIRLTMIHLASKDYKKLEYTDLDIHSKLSYTYSIVDRLSHLFLIDEVGLLIGMDSLLDMHNWEKAKEFTKKIRFFTYPRPGVTPPTLDQLTEWFDSETAFSLMSGIMGGVTDHDTMNISSTEIRKAVKEHKGLENLVPASVAEYIYDNHLYEKEDEQ